MQISSSYNIDYASGIESQNRKTWSRVQETTLASGDTVDISSEARELFSKMIHKYDTSSSATGESAGATATEDQGARAGGAGGAGGPDDSTSADSIKNQIQSLKSQLASLVSQMGKGGDSAAMGKINALESQIAALEAQLNEMQSA